MSELDVNLAGKSLADYANTQLRLALGAVLYTNTADMWRRYLNQCGYSGDLSYMLQKYYVDYSVPLNFRNYISAGAFVGFSPRSLFTGSDVGVWYDLDDNMDAKIAWVAANGTGGFLTAFPDHALFQDSTGLTPVTGVGQPLGLVLDKSKGLALGTEMLVVPYTGTASGLWTVTAAGVQRNSSTTGVANVSNIGNVTYSASKTYLVTFTVSNFSGDSFTLSLGGGANVGQLTGNGNYSFRMRGGGASASLQFIPWGGSAGTADITAFSVKELAGNHRTQATAANRPLWGARKNLFVSTESIGDAYWTEAGSITVTPNAALSPANTLTATKLDFAASGLGTYTRQIQASVAGNLYCSVYLRGDVGGELVTLSDLSGTNTALAALTTSWQRYSLAVTSSGAAILAITATSGTPTVYAWGAQADRDGGRYQRVTTATDYDAAGFPKFATYNGVNQSMATASIDFTATDKMTVSAGVTKLSDAARGVLFELSVNAAANAGSYLIEAPGNIAAEYRVTLYGTTTAQFTVTPYAAPVSNVLAISYDIAGAAAANEIVVRVNGATPTTNLQASPAGTGNFGNYPMYFGARAGASLYFNGQENQSFVINKILTAPQLAQLESFINSKTGAY